MKSRSLKLSFSLFLLLSIIPFSYAQIRTSFKSVFDSANPVKEEMHLSIDERIKIHNDFLGKAIQKDHKENIFLGYSFLVSDHMRNQDYVRSQKLINTLDSLANDLNVPQWKGHVAQRKAILALRLDDRQKAVQYFETSITLCGLGKDSLCVAEAIEQLSLLHSHLKNFNKSDSLYYIGIKLIKKFGNEKSLAIAYNNRAIRILERAQYREAIQLYNLAIPIFKKHEMVKEMAKAMNNLADGHRRLGENNKAIKILNECMKINKEENFSENLKQNYINISTLYESIGDYKSSLYYSTLYHDLRDSLQGVETLTKIAEINAKYEVSKKEMELKEQKLSMENEILTAKINNIILFISLLLTVVFLAVIYVKLIKNSKSLGYVQKIVDNLTIDNKTKKVKIDELEQAIAKFKVLIHPQPIVGDKHAASQFYKTILTQEDWIAFKRYFDINFPGFIQKLRDQHPQITDSEERLFLLLKLNLNTNEISAILGIAQESVKKTRSRLRKKLDIGKDSDLQDYVSQF